MANSKMPNSDKIFSRQLLPVGKSFKVLPPIRKSHKVSNPNSKDSATSNSTSHKICHNRKYLLVEAIKNTRMDTPQLI